MESILAERTVNVEVDGQPAGTIRVAIGMPVKVDDGEWKAAVEIHGPGEDPPLVQCFVGVDAWQAVKSAFWISVPLVRSRAPADARLTFLGDEDWSCDLSAGGA
jgi:hypothetical protein